MGGKQDRPSEPKPTMDDILLELKMASKKFQSDSRRAEKEKQ